MKKLLYLSLVVTLGLFSSCSEDDSRFNNDRQSGWVQYLNGSAVNAMFKEGGKITIPVKLNSPVNTDGLEVSYEIVDVAGSTSSLLSHSGKLYFEKGSVDSNIVLDLLGTSLSNSVEFDVKLSSTSRDNVLVGLMNGETSVRPIVKRVKLCSNEISLSYTGVSSLDGEPVLSGWSPTVTPVAGTTNQFQFNTLWGTNLVGALAGAGYNGQFIYPGIITINDDNTLTIVTTGNAAQFTGGSGTYDPCTKTFSYTLNQGIFTNPFSIDVVLTANN
jgi:hypothetical protein